MTRRLRVWLVFWITVVSGLITITTFVSEQSWEIDVRIPPGFWALLTAIGLFVLFEFGQHYIDMMQVAYHRAHARRCRELLPRIRELRDLMKCAKGSPISTRQCSRTFRRARRMLVRRLLAWVWSSTSRSWRTTRP